MHTSTQISYFGFYSNYFIHDISTLLIKIAPALQSDFKQATALSATKY
jgi:hypothetical protein